MHSPRRDEKYSNEIYSSSLKTETRKSSNDYYYNKENELHTKKHETDATLLPPRTEKYSNSYVSKNYSDNYGSRLRNDSFSPIHVNVIF